MGVVAGTVVEVCWPVAGTVVRPLVGVVDRFLEGVIDTS